MSTRRVDCPFCGRTVPVLTPPYRRGHRPIGKLYLHNRPDGGRCSGSHTVAPEPETTT